jgi:hypothetical protein
VPADGRGEIPVLLPDAGAAGLATTFTFFIGVKSDIILPALLAFCAVDTGR